MLKVYPTYAAALAVAKKRPGENQVIFDTWNGTLHVVPLRGPTGTAHPYQVLATVEYEKGASA